MERRELQLKDSRKGDTVMESYGGRRQISKATKGRL
jgi:hypothetical protein